jgi:hypothetical protein
MTYRLLRFGTTDKTIDLPLAAAEFDAGTAGSVSGIVKTVDGFYDTLGTARAPMALPYELPLAAELVAATVAALSTSALGLRALRGERLALWREMSVDGALQWCWARLMRKGAPRGPGNRMWQPVELSFEITSPWYGAYYDGDGWLLDDGFFFDNGLYLDTGLLTTIVSGAPFTITHGGDAEITAIVITVTAAAGAAITALTVKVGATSIWEWTYTGTIAAGKALVVDCGAQTVKNDGTADYAHFDLTSNHNQNYWFAFQPGANTVTVTMTGGGATSTIAFAYYEAWE